MSNPDNWRGNEDTPRAAKYRWQESSPGHVGTAIPRNQSRWRLAAFTSAFLMMFGGVLYIVLRTPPVTPLIVLSATEYGLSMPPNAWATEDIDALRSLDRNSVEIHQICFDQPSDDALQRLQEMLKVAAERPGEALVVHVTMHAGVNGKGIPCLIPPSANPMNDASWFELSKLIQELNRTPKLQAKRKLVVVDGIRRLANWELGTPFNTFVARVAERFNDETARGPNTAILLATGINQAAWTSREIQGSVFGRFLQLGLAGVADDPAVGGDGDERVTLFELDRFLKLRVNQWSVANRACRQVPLLLYSGDDFKVTSCLNAKSRRRMRAELHSPPADSNTITSATLETAWRAFNQVCADGEFLRMCPRKHGQLLRQLLRLEQLATAGRGYERSAHRLLDEIELRIGRVSRAKSEAPEWNRSLAHRWNTYQEHPVAIPSFVMHDTVAAAYMGQIDVTAMNKVQQSVSAVNGGRSLITRNDLRMDASFFEILRKYQVSNRWKDKGVIQRVVDLRARANRMATPIEGGNGLPSDERAHRHVRSLVDTADTHRRLAQDYLLAGESSGKHSIANEIAAARDSYISAEEHFQEVTDAYEFRDRLLCEIPFVLQFVLDPLRMSEPDSSAYIDGSGKSLSYEGYIAELVNLLPKLTANLDETKDSMSDYTSLSRRWEQVQTAIANEAKHLLDSAPSAIAARKIDAILAQPILNFEQRVVLRSRRDEVVALLSNDFFQPEQTHNEIDPVAEQDVIHNADKFVTEWSAVPRNPMMTLVAGSVTTNSGTDDLTELSRIENDGERLRLSLLMANELDEDKATQIHDAERRERATAALWYERPEIDPIQTRRRYDLQEWLAWRSDRAVLEFLGPVQVGDIPAFAIAASDYLAAAHELWPRSDFALRKRSLAKFVSEIPDLLNVHATRQTTAGESLAVHAALDPATKTAIANGKLNGHASLLFRLKQASKIADATTAKGEQQPFVAIPGEPQTFELEAPLSADRLVAVFRGNEFSEKIEGRNAVGHRIVARPSLETDTTVTVHRNHTELSLVLLLDGSSSMRNSEKGKSKIANSKIAFNTLLSQLADLEGVRCGVTFYGHRVGYSVGEETESIRVHPAYEGQIPDGLTPEDDVERLLPLGRFQELEIAAVRQELTKLTGWGQSPHYRALLSAVEEFGGDRESSQRAIIVFSDGDDIAMNNNGARRLETISWSEVIDSTRRSGIPVHFVSPGSTDAADQAALLEIQNSSGGSLRSSDRISTLLPEIMAQSATDSFAITGKKSVTPFPIAGPKNSVTKEVASVGSDVHHGAEIESIGTQVISRPVTITDANRFQSIAVNVSDIHEELQINGGENIELMLQPHRRQLVVPTYRQRFAREVRLVDATNLPTDVSAFLHRPERSGADVTFQVSFQHSQQKYVPRPHHVWVEITPVGSKEHAPFVFYDGCYLPDAPVPVLQCHTPDWPTTASQAAFKIWCAVSRKAQVGERVSYRSIIDQEIALQKHRDVSLYAAKPVHDADDEVIFELTEQHSADSNSFGKLKVEFLSTVRPNLVEHRYDKDRRLVTHRFSFQSGVLPEIEQGEIRVTHHAEIARSSWHSANSLSKTIDVSHGDEVIYAK